MDLVITNISQCDTLKKNANLDLTNIKKLNLNINYDILINNFTELIKLFPKLKHIRIDSFEQQPHINNFILPELPKRIRTVIFGEKIYARLCKLPPRLKSITLETDIYCNCKFPKSLKYIKFGPYYNQVLPELQHTSIKSLVLGYKFNQHLTNLPNNLQNLTLGWNYNKMLPELPNSLIFIKFGWEYNQPLFKLPNSIKYIKFGRFYNLILLKLPESLVSIRFGYDYNKMLPTLPQTLRKLIFGSNFNQVLPPLPNRIKFISFGDYYNQYLPPLPDSLRKLSFGSSFNKLLPVELPYLLYKIQFKTTNMFKIFKPRKINQFNNFIFKQKSVYCGLTEQYVIIIKKLNLYLYYILYNKTFIPFEIYNYIYINFNLTFNNK